MGANVPTRNKASRNKAGGTDSSDCDILSCEQILRGSRPWRYLLRNSSRLSLISLNRFCYASHKPPLIFRLPGMLDASIELALYRSALRSDHELQTQNSGASRARLDDRASRPASNRNQGFFALLRCVGIRHLGKSDKARSSTASLSSEPLSKGTDRQEWWGKQGS